MPLRDFDQVRERIHLRVEVRHIAQGVFVVLVLVGGAFAGGVWYAKSKPAEAGPPAVTGAADAPTGLPPAAVAIAEAVSRTVDAPIYPKPVVVAAHDPEPAATPVATAQVAAAAPDDFAAAPGERPIAPTEGAPSAAEATPEPEAAAVSPPTVAAKPAPEPPPVAPPKPTPEPPPVIAVKTPPAPPPAKLPPPPGLGLFGTLRMAPTVALVSAVAAPPKPVVAPPPPVVAAADKTVPHKPPVRPREDDVRPPPVSSHYVIQVKAFFNEQEAKSFEADLRAKGYTPKLTSTEDAGKGTIYRVRLGPFDRPEAARALQKQFEAAEGHTTIILGVP